MEQYLPLDRPLKQCGIYTTLLLPGFIKQALMTAGLLKSVTLSQVFTITSLSESVVVNLPIMYNCLNELANLSWLLQLNSITTIEEQNRVLLTKQTLESLESKSGFHKSQITSKFSEIELCLKIGPDTRNSIHSGTY